MPTWVAVALGAFVGAGITVGGAYVWVVKKWRPYQ